MTAATQKTVAQAAKDAGTEPIAKTPEQIRAETAALLAAFSGEAEGPSLAEIERQNRIDQATTSIGRAAVEVKELLVGTPDDAKLLGVLNSLKTAKDRAIAAIKSIPDVVFTPEVGEVHYAGNGKAAATLPTTPDDSTVEGEGY